MNVRRFLASVATLPVLLLSAPAGTLLLLNGTAVEGELALDNGIVVRGEKPLRVPFSSVLRATFGEPKAEVYVPGLVLTNGARLAGQFGSLTEPAVKMTPGGFALPSSQVAWAIYQPTGLEVIAQIPPGKTGALLPGGDFFEGSPKSADASSVKVLNPIFGPRIFDMQQKELHALVLRDVQPAPTTAFEVLKADGSLLPATGITAPDASALVLRHALYDGLRVEARDLVEIRAASHRFTALETLKPAKIETPGGQPTGQAYAMGKMLDGSPLLLGGKPARGFSSLAGAAISWDVPPKSVMFVARVAAAPSNSIAQKLTFTVYADGKAAAHSPLLGSGDAPAILQCPLPPNTRSVSLKVEGPQGSGIWADPVILRR